MRRPGTLAGGRISFLTDSDCWDKNNQDQSGEFHATSNLYLTPAMGASFRPGPKSEIFVCNLDKWHDLCKPFERS
jgi:hypothetical protein